MPVALTCTEEWIQQGQGQHGASTGGLWAGDLLRHSLVSASVPGLGQLWGCSKGNLAPGLSCGQCRPFWLVTL